MHERTENGKSVNRKATKLDVDLSDGGYKFKRSVPFDRSGRPASQADAQMAKVSEIKADPLHDKILHLILKHDQVMQDIIDRLSGEIKDLKENNELLKKRRGGECSKCGSWVCPPLTCTSCNAGEDYKSVLRKTNGDLTIQVARQAEELEAKDELIGWVWKTSVTLFEAKDRCKKALEG